MNELFKEIFEGFNEAQNIARQISKENEPQETEEEILSECCGRKIKEGTDLCKHIFALNLKMNYESHEI